MQYKVKVGISNRHIHLTKDTYEKLFDEDMSKRNDLNQIGEFASNQVVTIKTDAGEIPNVRVLGPFRDYDQIEISKSDARVLKINPPVRNSGELDDAEDVIVYTNKATILIKGCIIAKRHVHMNPVLANTMGIKNLDPVKFIINGNRSGVIDGVAKVSENGYFEVHLDKDEANAFNLEKNDEITLEV